MRKYFKLEHVSLRSPVLCAITRIFANARQQTSRWWLLSKRWTTTSAISSDLGTWFSVRWLGCGWTWRRDSLLIFICVLPSRKTGRLAGWGSCCLAVLVSAPAILLCCYHLLAEDALNTSEVHGRIAYCFFKTSGSLYFDKWAFRRNQ